MSRQMGVSYWFDLPVRDSLDAQAFYEKLFGWRFSKLQGETIPNYWVIQAEKLLIGGLRQVSDLPQVKIAPIVYITVEKLEPVLVRVRELGGKLVGDRVDLGDGRGSFQLFRDREGNLMGLWAQD